VLHRGKKPPITFTKNHILLLNCASKLILYSNQPKFQVDLGSIKEFERHALPAFVWLESKKDFIRSVAFSEITMNIVSQKICLGK